MSAVIDLLANTGLGSCIVLALGIAAIFAAAYGRNER